MPKVNGFFASPGFLVLIERRHHLCFPTCLPVPPLKNGEIRRLCHLTEDLPCAADTLEALVVRSIGAMPPTGQTLVNVPLFGIYCGVSAQYVNGRHLRHLRRTRGAMIPQPWFSCLYRLVILGAREASF